MLYLLGHTMYSYEGCADPQMLSEVKSAQVFVQGDPLPKQRLDRTAEIDIAALRAVRGIRTAQRQRTMSGQYYSTTNGRHQLFESQTERFWLVAADFDQACTAFAAQALKFTFDETWPATRQQYTPDIVKLVDNKVVISEVKSGEDHLDSPFYEMFSVALGQVGWSFEVLTQFPPGWRNLTFLAAYGRHRPSSEIARQVLHATANGPVSLDDLAGTGPQRPFRLATLFYLLWWQDLVTDLSVPLSGDTEIRTPVAISGKTDLHLRLIAHRVLGEAA